MVRNVNCKQIDNVAWCHDKRVKRSLWGFGARVCLRYEGKECAYQDKHTRPTNMPPPPPKKREARG